MVRATGPSVPREGKKGVICEKETIIKVWSVARAPGNAAFLTVVRVDRSAALLSNYNSAA